MRIGALFSAFVAILLLNSCGTTSTGSRSGLGGPPNMGGPPQDVRAAQIANEPTGDYFYGRRYYVRKTRFWGYLRKPGQTPTRSKLVIMNEARQRNPDRMSETGPPGQQYGFDANYEYRIWGNYTGSTAYDPNSNQFLPEFMATRFEVVNRNPGWLFTPRDHYDEYRFTLLP